MKTKKLSDYYWYNLKDDKTGVVLSSIGIFLIPLEEQLIKWAIGIEE